MYAMTGKLLKRENSQELEASWRPNAGPQTNAVESEADEIAYGGKAGGGKTDFLIGHAIKYHHRSIIFRRTFDEFDGIHSRITDILGSLGRWASSGRAWRLPMGKRIRYGACQYERDRTKYQGQADDFKAFDELTNWPEGLFLYLCGWNRAMRLGQKCQVGVTFNPPSNAEGAWVLDRYAAWLDPNHENPAMPGELRWFVRFKERDLEVEPRFCVDLDGEEIPLDSDHGGEIIEEFGKLPRLQLGDRLLIAKAMPVELLTDKGLEPYTPSSRTFVPAGMDDNPFLPKEYRARIDQMPEPLRSQLKYGDFGASRMDDPWQVIPTAWIELSFERWRRRTIDLGRAGCQRPSEYKTLSQIGADCARDGKDEAPIFKRYGPWFDLPIIVEKPERNTGRKMGTQILLAIDKGSKPRVVVDFINVGTTTYDWLNENLADYWEKEIERPYELEAFVASAKSQPHREAEGGLLFGNDRAVAWWNMRELLDPQNGHDIMLPPLPQLKADLCAPRYFVKLNTIWIEEKAKLRERLGRSPDLGDACLLAAFEEQVHTLEF